MQKRMLSHQELAGFCKNLSLLIQAGIGQSEAIYLMADEEEKKLREILNGLGAQLDMGYPLSTAVEECGVFPEYVVAMLRVGEQSGRMEETLFTLATYYEERSRFNQMLRNALAYPAMILLLLLVVIAVLLIEVMPVFDEVYASLGSRLTGLSAGLLQLGQVLKAGLPLLLVVLALVGIGVVLFSCCVPIRERVQSVWHTHFGDKGVAARFNNAQFAQALSMGLNSGLPLEESIELAEKLFVNIPGGAKRCQQCSKLLSEGAGLADAMKESKFLSPADCRMLSVGIRGGNSDRVMIEIASRLMEEAKQKLEQNVARVEPIMVFVASGLVGAILLSVMLPLANIMSSIG